MMDKVSKYLFDIQGAISLIDDFMIGAESFFAYQNDLKTQSAVERQLAIIGEAANKLLQEGVNLSNAPQIIGLRNRLIHSYDNIDATIIWAILKKHLPLLKSEVDAMM